MSCPVPQEEPDGLPSLAEVVGKNTRVLRGHIPGDRLASAARKHGLKWGTGRIADLEAGRVSPTVPTLVALALALGDIRGEPINLADLVYTDGFVSVTGDLVLSGEALRGYLSGQPVEVRMRDFPGGAEQVADLTKLIREVLDESKAQLARYDLQGVDETVLAAILQVSGEAEDRAAKTLGVDPIAVAVASARLWRRSLSDERDRRAGTGGSPQKRGRITRDLYTELEAEVRGSN